MHKFVDNYLSVGWENKPKISETILRSFESSLMIE